MDAGQANPRNEQCGVTAPLSDVQRARDALWKLDPSGSRSEWVRIGMAAKAAGVDFKDFNDWSAPAGNYGGKTETEATWRSLKLGGGVNAGTLFHLARSASASDYPTGSPAKRRTAHGAPISDWWNDASPAPADHPYIVRKHGSPAGLRVLRQSMKGWGKYPDADLDGWLLLPVKTPDGSLTSIQFIAPDGRKLNAWGCPMAGTFTVGAPIAGKPAYVVEGIGHAWSLNAVTGDAAVVAFGASNVGRTACTIKRTGAQPIIVPDRGQEAAATAAASLTGCAFAPLPSDLPVGADVNDLHLERGAAAVRAALNSALKPAPANDNLASATISPTPFTWADPAGLAPREWVYGTHLIRKYVSATIAPGGVGKSTLVVSDALAMASGKSIMGHFVSKPLRVWLWNGEDPTDEMQRRVVAAMIHHGITREDIQGRLFLDSGRDTPIKIGHGSPTGPQIATPVIEALISALEERQIDVLIADPFVALHSLPENDNGAMDAAVKAFALVADRTGCAIDLVHHSRKLNGADADMDSARGGSAIAGAVRAARALNPMSRETAQEFGIEERDRKSFVRVDDAKANLAPSSVARWFKLVSQPLHNATPERAGDVIGVAVSWTPPNPFDAVKPGRMRAAQDAVAGKGLREDARASNWVGHAIGPVLGIDSFDLSGKKQLKRIVAAWILNGVLAVSMTRDPRAGREVKTVDVGEFVSTTV